MVPVEIERKFTIKYLPKEVESIKKITQKHIFKDMICSIRVRKSVDMFNGNKVFTHTIKARAEKQQKYSICELERNISEEDYNKLQPFEGSRIIEKYRCIVPLENGLKAEVDIFEGWMEGLIIAEVEFQNVEQAENFVIPEWFDKCVPNREFSNRKLSTATRTEILEMVGCAQLEVNKKILKDLKQNSLKKNRP
jgi:adenylate cyclase